MSWQQAVKQETPGWQRKRSRESGPSFSGWMLEGLVFLPEMPGYAPVCPACVMSSRLVWVCLVFVRAVGRAPQEWHKMRGSATGHVFLCCQIRRDVLW